MSFRILKSNNFFIVSAVLNPSITLIKISIENSEFTDRKPTTEVFRGTIVNQAFSSLIWGPIQIRSSVPLRYWMHMFCSCINTFLVRTRENDFKAVHTCYTIQCNIMWFFVKDAQLALDRKRNFTRISFTKIKKNRKYHSLIDSICIQFKILKD